MLTHTARLANDVAELRAGDLDLHAYIDAVCARVATVDAQVCAFLPEPERRERLHRDAEALLSQFPILGKGRRCSEPWWVSRTSFT